ncbi:ribonucleoprotein RB97D isoform X2 [Drosophila grimshawi]|uniref:ribonucleoprotein RB97D isoform X2 n=1 Tax=Drosophila grimshawi TaxID=7222 RepID=UPI000C86EBCC|nr:ribonucleoprotein RB97D isoform X2 [Drosophila grimshawi]
MSKMVNNSNNNKPFCQEMRKMGGCFSGAAIVSSDLGQSGDIESENSEHLRRIFVGGLSLNTTAETMRHFFSQFGDVADAIVMRDPISNRSRCFGFVTFVEAASVENVQRTRPHIVDGKTVETKRAFPRHQFSKSMGHLSNIRTNKIFIGGLRDCHDETTLREYFAQFGNINSVKVLLDKETGRIRGFGFLEFEDIASAARALGKHLIGCKMVEVKKMFDTSKRLRLPIGGAACAGYGPPQPTTVDDPVYYLNYDPYQAQHSLPPSAFFNGWASYVAPYAPAPTMSHARQQPALNGYHPLGEFVHVATKFTRNHNSFVERSKNEVKPAQAKEANRQETAGKPIYDVKVESKCIVDVEKKWLAKDYKIFKPTGVHNSSVPPANHNDVSAPAYGV